MSSLVTPNGTVSESLAVLRDGGGGREVRFR